MVREKALLGAEGGRRKTGETGMKASKGRHFYRLKTGGGKNQGKESSTLKGPLRDILPIAEACYHIMKGEFQKESEGSGNKGR